MQDIWYGDKRDLIKWGTVVHLAHHHRIRTILQVAFFRPNNLSDRPRLESHGRQSQVAHEVWCHFRNLQSIQGLARRCALKIRVLGARFDPDKRDRYFRYVVRTLEAHRQRKVVLLDPDTGIEPKTRRTASHVGVAEIDQVWRIIRPGDWLVLYQHRRRVRGWQDDVRKDFVRACGMSDVRIFTSTSASDVAFFVATKP